MNFLLTILINAFTTACRSFCQAPVRFPMFPGHGSTHTCCQIQRDTWIYHSTWQEQNSFLHYIYYNWILPKWHIWYEELLGQNHFWHVPQTCPDLPSAIVRPARFFGVDFLLGTCACMKGGRTEGARTEGGGSGKWVRSSSRQTTAISPPRFWLPHTGCLHP